MKYFHITQYHRMSGGGVGSVITDLCEAMAHQSAEVYAISLFRRKGIDFNIESEWAKKTGIHSLIMQDSNADSKIKALFKLRKTIKELAKNDRCCLFLHLKWGVLAGIISTLGIKNIKRVEVYHSGYMRYKLQAFLSKPFIDHYIAVSKDAKRQLIEWFHIDDKKIDVVYNGVNVQYIRDLCRDHTKENPGFVFVSVGRLSFEKGFKTPIEAYSNLCRDNKLTNTAYTMVGDGNQREECESLSKGYVSFTGMVERQQAYHFIADATVMVLPSLWEGNSILMLEALALGRPMVVTDIPAFREVLGFEPLSDDEKCRWEWFGAVFRKEDVSSCESALLLAYDHWDELSSNSKKISELANEFSTVIQAEKYFRIAEF